MQPLRTVYCRAYQKALRLALPLLPYRKPQILRKPSEVAGIYRQKQIGSVMLVTDAGIRQSGLTRSLEEAFARARIRCCVFDRTVPNPTTKVIAEAVRMFRANGCGGLIGLGGGSSMDTAKAVGAQIAQPHKSLSDMAGILKVHRAIPLLTAVPTTAGTGSETTLAAVVTDSRTRHKYAINDFPLIPHYVLLDPEMTLHLPASLTATTGMDALTHAVEAYIGKSTTHETRREAEEAVRLIFKNLEKAYRSGSDRRARAGMAKAAFLAGDAFSQSYVGYVHAVAHSLGGKYNIAHGLANAVILPYVLADYGDTISRKLARLARVAGVADRKVTDRTAAALFIEAIRGMNRRMHIPEKLDGIKREDIPQLSAYADAEANPLYPVPAEWNRKELERVYYQVMKL